jgi:hypothetical protein
MKIIKSLRRSASGTNKIRGTTLIIPLRGIPSGSNKPYPLTRADGST